MTDKDDRKGTEGVTGVESAGIGTGAEAQTVEEAVAEEEARREEMSEAELDEAETRDRTAKALEERNSAAVPAVGSPDEEGREDSNLEDAVIGAHEKFGTGPDERTQP